MNDKVYNVVLFDDGSMIHADTAPATEYLLGAYKTLTIAEAEAVYRVMLGRHSDDADALKRKIMGLDEKYDIIYKTRYSRSYRDDGNRP